MNYLEAELDRSMREDPAIWHFIQQGSLDGVWYWDLEKPEQEYMSPEFWRLFGFDPADKQHLASEWQDLIFPEDLELSKTNIEKHLADPNHPYDQIVRYRCADGQTAWVRCRGLAIRDEDGTPLRMLGAHTDMTALYRERQMLAETRDELETIFQASTSGIIALDRDGRVLRCNDVARHMLGGLSDPTPFDWPENVRFLEPENQNPKEASADPIQRALSGHRLVHELHLLKRVTATSMPRYVHVNTTPLADRSTDIHTVVVLDDVSAEERNRQVVERKGRLDALGQLTGGIAHDFNNILTSLLYSIVMARRTEDDARRLENLSEAEASIDLAKSLTARLMAFARKQPGLSDTQTVEAILEGFERLVRPMLEESISVRVDLQDPDLIVFCELAQLESALMNLVLNSRDAILRSGTGDQITLQARAVEDRIETPGAPQGDRSTRFVEISVMDNGPGMDDETLARALDPFFTTKDHNSGTGLGLSTVYGFARQSSGDLRIYSEEGVGTTVQLRLPRGTQEGVREAPMPSSEITLGDGQTILLVEDEFHILKASTKLLTDVGYEVVTAASGREALDLIEAGTAFDLLLTDVVMPGELGGFQLARSARDLRPDLPIIYVSGYTGFTVAEMGEVQAPLLQKPASPAELSFVIDKLLKERSAHGPSADP